MKSISIIIPCRDRIESLSQCIGSVLLSKGKLMNTEKTDIEIIIVNDNSKDDFSKKVLNKFHNSDVKVINSTGVGPGFARNYGIANSKGDLIFFTDSDCVVDIDWIYNGYTFFEESSELIVQGAPWLFQYKENAYLAYQEETLYKLLFSSYISNSHSSQIDSRNLLIDRHLIDLLSDTLFSESFGNATAESRVFASKCRDYNIPIAFNQDIKVYHEDPISLLSVCHQKYRHGMGRIELWKGTPPEMEFLINRYFDTPIKNLISPDYVVPAHLIFLFGYYNNIHNKKLKREYYEIENYILKNYEYSNSSLVLINEFINSHSI